MLRSRARPIEVFDDALADEVRRMGRLMDDALGIGLAATQLGVMHRLLVYRVDPEAALGVADQPRVRVDRSDELETMEEGCLSLPGVGVEVERPLHVRVRASDETASARRGRGVRARGTRDPARDRPPRRRADPRSHEPRSAQAGDARHARGDGGRAARLLARRQRVKTVYLGTSDFAAAVLDRLADSAHRPALVVTRPDRPKGRGRRLQPPPVAVRARELGLDVIQPERLHEPEPLERIAAAAAGCAVRLRLRRADQGAAALGLRDAQRASLAAAALARRRAGGAGDHGRRRRRPACRSCG